jgi:hypothetical protein
LGWLYVGRWDGVTGMSTEMALPTQQAVSALFAFEDVLKSLPTAEWPAQHFHIPGVYARSLMMPAGSVVTSRVHKYDNISMILYGSCVVVQNGERWHFQAGDVWVTKAGTKRALYMPEDCKWATVHANPEAIVDPDNMLEYLTTNSADEAMRLIEVTA